MSGSPEIEDSESITGSYSASFSNKSKRGKSHPARLWTWGCAISLAVFTMLCCVFPLLFCVGVGVIAEASNSSTVTRHDSYSLEISTETVNLDITNPVGSIRIRGREGQDKIEVDVTRHASGFSKSQAESKVDDMSIDVRRSDDRYIIKATYDSGSGFNALGQGKVDMVIYVPRTVNMQIENNTGSISIRDVHILDNLQIENNVGSIEFQGKIGSQGTHQMATNVGSIEVEIESGSSFRLDARTDVGTISEDLSLSNKEENAQEVGQSLSGVYGESSNPDARLILQSNVGRIDIHD